MPSFTYKALRPDGSTAAGSIEAADRRTAQRLLGKRKLQPFEVRAEGAIARPAGKSAKAVRELEEAAADKSKAVRLKRGEIVQFTEELADLVGAGMQLEPALLIMEKRGEKSGIKVVSARIRDRIRDGIAFSSALRSASPSFDELFCNLAAAGEAGGSLSSILRRHAEYLRAMADLRGRFLFAMIYPAFLVVAGLAVSALFIMFLVPSLAKLIDRSGETAPFLIRMLMTISQVLNQWWWLVLILLVLGIAMAAVAFKRPEVRRWWDRFSLGIPLFGGIISGRFYVQFLQTLGNLMADGLPFLKAFHLAGGTTTNSHLQEQLDDMSNEVGEGRSLTAAMRRSGIFPDKLVDMVSVGEQTGHLADSLSATADRYDRDLTKKVEGLGAAIQPLIIIVMAVVVGTMAYFMISVIYDTISSMRGAR